VKILAILTSILGFGFQSFAQTDYTKILSDTAADMNKSNYCIKKSNDLELEDKFRKNLGRVYCVI